MNHAEDTSMKPTPYQHWILRMCNRGYKLGGYFAPVGFHALAKNGVWYLVKRATIDAMFKRGLLNGNVCWCYVTHEGWTWAKRRGKALVPTPRIARRYRNGVLVGPKNLLKHAGRVAA